MSINWKVVSVSVFSLRKPYTAKHLFKRNSRETERLKASKLFLEKYTGEISVVKIGRTIVAHPLREIHSRHDIDSNLDYIKKTLFANITENEEPCVNQFDHNDHRS